MTEYSLQPALRSETTTVSVQGQEVSFGGNVYTVEATENPRVYNFVDHSGARIPGSISLSPERTVLISMRGYVYEFDVKTEREQFFAKLLKETAGRLPKVTKLSAPMPGLLKSVHIEEGQHVKKGQKMFVLEAMKMENDLLAPHDGIATKIDANGGEAVEKGKILCVVEQAVEG